MPEKFENTKDPTPLITAIDLCNQSGSENMGHGFGNVIRLIDIYGEQGYTIVVKKLAIRGNIDIQRWVLIKARDLLNQENVVSLVNMFPRDYEIVEALAVLLAEKWDIAKIAVQNKICDLVDELDRIEKPYNDAKEIHAPGYILRNFDVAVEKPYDRKHAEIKEALYRAGGKDNIESLAASLGLAFMKSEKVDVQEEIIKLLSLLASTDYLREMTTRGLVDAFLLSKGESVSPYWLHHPHKNKNTGDMPYGLTLPKKFALSRTDLNQLWKNLTGNFVVNEKGKMTSGHRRISQELYRDPKTDSDVRTIFKYCDAVQAQHEKENFEYLAMWGLPIPKVYEITENGIRVEDLTEGNTKKLIMDEFNELSEALNAANNAQELKSQLQTYLKFLKERGITPEKLKRTLGVVLDNNHVGKLYFVDVDHFHLER